MYRLRERKDREQSDSDLLRGLVIVIVSKSPPDTVKSRAPVERVHGAKGLPGRAHVASLVSNSMSGETFRALGCSNHKTNVGNDEIEGEGGWEKERNADRKCQIRQWQILRMGESWVPVKQYFKNSQVSNNALVQLQQRRCKWSWVSRYWSLLEKLLIFIIGVPHQIVVRLSAHNELRRLSTTWSGAVDS